MEWLSAADMRVSVENEGFTKIADDSTYDAFNTDSNGATVNYRIVPPGDLYTSGRYIEGRIEQTPASIAEPVPSSLIDIPGAFDVYRDLTQQMAGCPATVQLTDTQDQPLSTPIPPGTPGRLNLTPNQTNVLTVSATDLDNLSEITFVDQPSSTQPLLINVTGATFDGTTPNLAGVSGTQAPYILWNFPTASAITVTGGDTIEGTLYAPNAVLSWQVTQNIQGNIIAAAFNHGPNPGRTTPREVHDFPFAATLACSTIAPEAELTLVKVVTNDNGGAAKPGDWTLTANGPTQVTGPGDSTSIIDQPVTPGDYVLSETAGAGGYTPSGWDCTAGTLDGATVTLADGEDATCTITNDDNPPRPPQAELTLVKVVTNNNGGAAEPGVGHSPPTGPPRSPAPATAPASSTNPSLRATTSSAKPPVPAATPPPAGTAPPAPSTAPP